MKTVHVSKFSSKQIGQILRLQYARATPISVVTRQIGHANAIVHK